MLLIYTLLILYAIVCTIIYFKLIKYFNYYTNNTLYYIYSNSIVN